MAHWKKGFPSKYLQVSDLETPIVATIKAITFEKVGSSEDAESKLVMHFQERVKPCVLNLTRAEAIEGVVGDGDTDKWPGHRIKLYRGQTRYQGKKVACIAVGEPPADDIDDAMQSLKSEAF